MAEGVDVANPSVRPQGLEGWLATLRPVVRSRLAIAVNMAPFLAFLFVFFFVPLGIMFLYSIPVAYYIAIRAGRYRHVLVLLVLIPFWITFIIRVYALYQIFHQNRPVYSLLLALNWPAGQPFLSPDPPSSLGSCTPTCLS